MSFAFHLGDAINPGSEANVNRQPRLHMPATPEDLIAHLTSIGMAHTTTPHRPIFTVEEGTDLKRAIPGGHSKNLFLKDKKGSLWLICALGDTRIDLNATARHLGVSRFSFGSPDLLLDVLGVTPGSVTLFALINDPSHRLRLVLDAALLACEHINFHPLTNAATTTIERDGLFRFLEVHGRVPLVLHFDEAGWPHAENPKTD